MTKNLAAAFAETAASRSADIAIQYRKGDAWAAVSYNELAALARAVGAFLSKEGIRKDDRVAILMENRPEWPAVFFGAVSTGAAVVPINPESTRNEIENILRDSGSKILFTGTAAKACPVTRTVSVDSGEFKDISQPSAGVRTDIGPSDLACILYTSGTTDIPKGVMLTHANLISNCDSIYQLGVITGKDAIVSMLPLHHTYPLTVTMISPLLCGGTIVYPGSLRPEAVLKAMQDLNPTIFVAVPQIFYLFHRKMMEAVRAFPPALNLLCALVTGLFYAVRKKTGINLSRFFYGRLHRKFGRRMRLLISGGAKLDENVERDLLRLGFTIVEGYGLTETSPVLTFNSLGRPKIGSAGKAVPGVELKIDEADEKGVGEVLARGPNIMKGYYRRQDLTDAVIRDGWFRTGDLGWIDRDGYLFLTGRLKDIIVLSSGKNIYPEEIEEAYAKAAPVKEICVFDASGVQGVRDSNALWAVVRPDLENFRKFGEVNLRFVLKERFDNLSKSLPSHKRLMGFTITLEDLPHTLLGKIKRYAVKEMYGPKVTEERAGAAPAPREISDEDKALSGTVTGRKVLECLTRQSGIARQITPVDSIELDLGIDSLGRIELASSLEKAFDAEIKDEAIGSAFSVRDLIVGVGDALTAAKGLPPEEREIIVGPDYWKKLLEVLPKKENLEKIDLHPGLASWAIGFILTSVPYLLFKLFYSLKAEGRENVPGEGPYILYANHTSFFDGPAVAAALPRRPMLELFYIGFRPYLEAPVMRNLVKTARLIPLDFSAHFLEALRSCYYVLQHGKGLCVFPEGLRSFTSEVGQFKKGFGILAKETGAKLVPAAILGTYEAWPRAAKYPKRHPILVRFGTPVAAEDLEREGRAMGAVDGYDAICLAARKALVELKERQ